MEDHPELAAARAEVQAAEAALLQAGVRPNPVFGAELEDTRSQTRTTTVQFSQPIELGGKRSARVEAAERGRDVALAQLAARRAEIRAHVVTAYFDAAAAQERVRLAEAALEIARSGSSAAGKRVIAGKVSPVEETKARVAEAGVRLELVQARGERQSALHALQAATASAADGVESAADVPPEPDAGALARRIDSSPVLHLARLEVERLGALARLERAKGVPDLTVSVGAKRSQELDRTQPVVALSIPLPVFDSNRGAELEALRRQDKARADTQAAELRLRGDVLRAAQRLRTARAEAEALASDVLPGAQSAHDAASKGFELGKFGFLDVLDAQRTLLQTKSQHLRALADAHRAAAEIDRLLGRDESAPAPSTAPNKP